MSWLRREGLFCPNDFRSQLHIFVNIISHYTWWRNKMELRVNYSQSLLTPQSALRCVLFKWVVYSSFYAFTYYIQHWFLLFSGADNFGWPFYLPTKHVTCLLAPRIIEQVSENAPFLSITANKRRKQRSLADFMIWTIVRPKLRPNPKECILRCPAHYLSWTVVTTVTIHPSCALNHRQAVMQCVLVSRHSCVGFVTFLHDCNNASKLKKRKPGKH